ncbi:MAG: hypothetical protein FJX71_01995 [Alphaproteobacteria bacterium]|nr:hypothetical protein [Alphaproteobacteria bacterium]
MKFIREITVGLCFVLVWPTYSMETAVPPTIEERPSVHLLQVFRMKGFDTPLWVSAEKVTSENIAGWLAFQGQQRESSNEVKAIEIFGRNAIPNARFNDVTIGDMYRHIDDTITHFSKLLRIYNEQGLDRWDFYVIFASSKDPRTSEFLRMRDIEMTVLSMSEKGLPFFVQMGICRSAEYMNNGSPKHSGIARLLHGCAARNFSEKIFLYTLPKQAMRLILERVLPQGTFWVKHKKPTDEFYHPLRYEEGRYTMVDRHNTNLFSWSAGTNDLKNRYPWLYYVVSLGVIEDPAGGHFMADARVLAKLFEDNIADE